MKEYQHKLTKLKAKKYSNLPNNRAGWKRRASTKWQILPAHFLKKNHCYELPNKVCNFKILIRFAALLLGRLESYVRCVVT